MATASSMILRSLRLIGEKPVGGTLTSAEQTAYLSDLNTMLESWSLDRLLVYQLLQESLALTSGVSSYTIGSGGAFNTARPNRIVDPCFIRDSGGTDSPLEIISAETYGAISFKTDTIGDPSYLFYDQAYVSGLGTIRLYPEPTSGLTLYINSWKQLQSFAAIGDAVSLPPGYQRAIEYNFAIEVAGGFIPVSQEVAKIARDSKALISGINISRTVLGMPPGLVTTRNGSILTNGI